MKIVLTGGGSAGHFYPLIAIAEEVNTIVDEENLIGAQLYFISNTPYDKKALFDHGIAFVRVTAGKRRLYSSIHNVFDVFKMGLGVVTALFKVFFIYPDVVIAKGGFASYPTLMAARILNIPVVIHESDTIPGRVNMRAAKFAYRIAVSWPEASDYFPKEKVAHTGQPVRRELATPIREGAHEHFGLDPNIPTILILGGSQGAELINDAILGILPRLLDKYQVIHQTGLKNEKIARDAARVALGEYHPHSERYKAVGYLTAPDMVRAAGAANLVISRSGSAIFEIAAWGLPSLLIPITESNADHQRKNAYSYARTGACMVTEEGNLTPNLLIAEIDKIMEDAQLQQHMSEAAQNFFKPDAAYKIARLAIETGLEHES